jgi:hypothetical protein
MVLKLAGNAHALREIELFGLIADTLFFFPHRHFGVSAASLLALLGTLRFITSYYFWGALIPQFSVLLSHLEAHEAYPVVAHIIRQPLLEFAHHIKAIGNKWKASRFTERGHLDALQLLLTQVCLRNDFWPQIVSQAAMESLCMLTHTEPITGDANCKPDIVSHPTTLSVCWFFFADPATLASVSKPIILCGGTPDFAEEMAHYLGELFSDRPPESHNSSASSLTAVTGIREARAPWSKAHLEQLLWQCKAPLALRSYAGTLLTEELALVAKQVPSLVAAQVLLDECAQRCASDSTTTTQHIVELAQCLLNEPKRVAVRTAFDGTRPPARPCSRAAPSTLSTLFVSSVPFVLALAGTAVLAIGVWKLIGAVQRQHKD